MPDPEIDISQNEASRRAARAAVATQRATLGLALVLLLLGLVAIAASRNGYVPIEFVMIGTGIAAVLVLGGIAYWNAASIARIEAARGRAEREISAATARLRESEARFRQMADHAPGMVWMSEPDGACSFLSQSWYALTGQTPETALGTGWLAAVHPDEQQVTADILAAANRRHVPFRFDLRLRDTRGDYRWAFIAATPRFDAAGEYLGYVGSIMDITDRKRMEDELREADHRKDEFLAMLGHELRNPLAPIRSAAGVLQRLPVEHPQLTWARELIDRQVAHMTRLIDDLLDVARITRGTVVLKSETVDLCQLVREAIESCRPLIDDRKHRVELDLPAGPEWAVADPDRLGQVLANLVNNAAKYMDEGGLIRVSAARHGDELEVRVLDRGYGIDGQLLPRIFDLFTQGERSIDRAQGGLGIGLTLTKALVELHGGSIRAESAGRGKGAEFVLRLPRGEPVVPASGQAPASRVSVPRLSRHPTRVLVVDDNVDSAEALATLLGLEGHAVATSTSAADAIERARGFRPRVVLLDIGLPGMDGYEVARRLRAMPETRDAMLVAVTGYGGDADRRRSMDAGFAHHLVKPVDARTISALLDSAAAA